MLVSSCPPSRPGAILHPRRNSFKRVVRVLSGSALDSDPPPSDDRAMNALEKADAAERAMMEELDRVVVKSVIYTSGERDPREPIPRPPDTGKYYMMGH